MENKNKQNEHYGLFTATAMIIGIVIGSGIFFKVDDVLKYTGGSVGLGILVFVIGALSIIFGSLTLTELSVRTEGPGGIISYFEHFISPRAASGFGWFQTFIYFPTINAVISWVAAIYIFLFLGYKASLEAQIGLGFLIFTFFYGINILSYKLGGYIQNVAAVIKLIPLIAIAIAGIFYHGQSVAIPEGMKMIGKTQVGLGWLAALAPIAFSYDGWVVSVNITNEVKNSKRNMPLALIIGPLTVLSVYILYFVGLNNMLGSEYIMTTGNEAVNKAGEIMLGSSGTKLLLFFIVISVLGVVNGMTLGSIRMPWSLASKNMLPDSPKIAKLHPKYELSLPSALIAYITAALWMLLHYLTTKSGILKGSDISEIAIVFSYICYMLLYIKVLSLRKQGEVKSLFKGVICPVLGLAGSLIILIGGLISNPFYVACFIIFCGLVCLSGALYCKGRVDKKY